jgi:hypothetical protein
MAKLCGAEMHTISAKGLSAYGADSDLRPTPPQEFFAAQERASSWFRIGKPADMQYRKTHGRFVVSHMSGLVDTWFAQLCGGRPHS